MQLVIVSNMNDDYFVAKDHCCQRLDEDFHLFVPCTHSHISEQEIKEVIASYNKLGRNIKACETCKYSNGCGE